MKLTPTQVRALRIIRATHQGRGKRGITFAGLRSFGIRSGTFNALRHRGLVERHYAMQGRVGFRGTFRTTELGRAVLTTFNVEATD